MFESRPLLHEMIADKAEGLFLLKDGRLLAERAVAKSKRQAIGDAISFGSLIQVATGSVASTCRSYSRFAISS